MTTQLFSKAQKKIEKLRNTLKDQSIIAKGSVTKEMLVLASKQVEHHAPKFAILVDDDEITCDSLEPLLEELFEYLQSIVNCSKGIITQQYSGESLKKQSMETSDHVLTTFAALLKGIAEQKPKQEINTLVGEVWEVLKEYENTPLTNEEAIKRAILTNSKFLKDAIDEISQQENEDKENQNNEEENQQNNGGIEDDDEDDFGGSSENLTENQKHLFSLCKKHIQLVYDSVRRLGIYIGILKIEESSTEIVDWMERIVNLTEKLPEYVDNFVCVFYDDFSVEEFTEELKKLRRLVDALLEQAGTLEIVSIKNKSKKKSTKTTAEVVEETNNNDNNNKLSPLVTQRDFDSWRTKIRNDINSSLTEIIETSKNL